MTSSLEIRRYQESDRQALINLLETAFPNDPPWNKAGLCIDLKTACQPDGLLVGINHHGHFVATVMAGYDGHRGWINGLATHPEYRSQGYGKAMLDHAIALLTQMGAVKVNLQIRGDNLKLKNYYENLGFQVEDRISMGLLTSNAPRQ